MKYIKRRRKPNENKNKMKANRRQGSQGNGLLGEIHPTVSHLTISITFVSPQKSIISEQTRSYSPQDNCDFTCSCEGACGGGSFDFSERIQSAVAARTPSTFTTTTCERERYGGLPEPCGCVLECKIDATYFSSKE